MQKAAENGKMKSRPYFLPNRIYDQMKHDLLVGASNIHWVQEKSLKGCGGEV